MECVTYPLLNPIIMKASRLTGYQKSTKFKRGDYGSSSRSKSLGKADGIELRANAIASRKLAPLPDQPTHQCSLSEKGINIVVRLIQRGWDCHTSMPRYGMYLLRNCYESANYLLVLRDGQWKLLRDRGSGR
jgi:hypothetical protein